MILKLQYLFKCLNLPRKYTNNVLIHFGGAYSVAGNSVDSYQGHCWAPENHPQVVLCYGLSSVQSAVVDERKI